MASENLESNKNGKISASDEPFVKQRTTMKRMSELGQERTFGDVVSNVRFRADSVANVCRQ